MYGPYKEADELWKYDTHNALNIGVLRVLKQFCLFDIMIYINL